MERFTTGAGRNWTLSRLKWYTAVILNRSSVVFGHRSTMMQGSNNSPFSEHRREPTRSCCAARTGN